ncbi:MAG: DUF5916 domain-containing protein [Thermoanaerobaculia bacterium]|nr:DUF5916 domain-containing protein [Thermoanaerobaculia bacterium]
MRTIRPSHRRNGSPRAVALALALLVAPIAAVRAQDPREDRPTLRALRIDQPILVDGIFAEEPWQRAEVGTGFITREPEDHLPASERTEFSVLFTSQTLYVGIRAFDSDPAAIVAKEMERDAFLGLNDDSVTIVLDTFLDRRNSYSFEINPNGARTDALVADEGRSLNQEWDGVWQVAARRTGEGWFAEVAIPFETLRFARGGDTWGLNVRRFIRRKNEEVNWAPLGRDIGPRNSTIPLYAAHYVSFAGTLTGLAEIRPSRPLDIKPFVVAELTERPQTEAGTEDDVEVGLDLKWGLTRSLTLDLTYNTDFAEVEVDQQQINLTRFSLFFPEKREFFLENAGIFDFGPPNRAEGEREVTLMEVFFSRRIGLDGGEEVPIEWGGRVTGRVGGWNLGLLNVLTDSVDEEGRVVPETRFSVARLNRNIGRRSSLGAIFTERDAVGAGANRVAGLDLDFKPSDRSQAFAFVASSDDPRFEGDDVSWGTGYLWQTSNLRVSADVVEAQRNFSPEVGFLLRSDFTRYNPRVRYTPPVRRAGIRNWFLEAVVDYFERESLGELESRRVQLSPLGWRSNHEDLWRLAWIDETEQLFEPFEIRPGVIIAPGLYRFDGWELAGRTNTGRLVSFRGNGGGGDFYDGERIYFNAIASLRPSRFFRSELLWSWNDVDLPAGDFVTNLYSVKFNVSFTPELRLNTLAQYNDAAELVGLNVRFNWIYRPGADLFVVYNQGWDAPSFSSRRTDQRQLIVKFTYLW